jgi:PQQ-dependent catabolism-associated CXXCW motif protein
MIAVNRRSIMLVLTMLALAPASVFGDDMPEPEGFRTENYRAPTPATLRGARVVTTAEAPEIWQRGGAVFVDVLPRPPRPANLPAGTIWRETPRLSIPGSVWLPDTGYGSLAPAMENYLRTNVAQASGNDRARPLVVYCVRSCWMSWNTAKRILAMGYTEVVWYPDGTDGWSEANLPLQLSTPDRGQSNSHLLWGGCGGAVMRVRCRRGASDLLSSVCPWLRVFRPHAAGESIDGRFPAIACGHLAVMRCNERPGGMMDGFVMWNAALHLSRAHRVSGSPARFARAGRQVKT